MGDIKTGYYTSIITKNGGCTAWCSDRPIIGYDPSSEDPRANVYFVNGLERETTVKRAIASFEENEGKGYFFEWCQPAPQRLLSFKERVLLLYRFMSQTPWWRPHVSRPICNWLEKLAIVIGTVAVVPLIFLFVVIHYVTLPFQPLFHALRWSLKKQNVLYSLLNERRVK